MKRVALAIAALAASGCYCAHDPGRFVFRDEPGDADVGSDAARDAARDSAADASSDAPTDAYCERPLGTIDDCASCRDHCGWACDPSGCNDARTVALGGRHSCARRDDGVVCWGQNPRGQLGNGSRLESSTPVRVRGLPDDVVQLEAGEDHTCARTSSGAVYCWGSNEVAGIGDGTTTDRLVAVPVVDLGGIAIDIGVGVGTCAVLDSGAVRCWGLNDQGQIGDGTTGGGALRPVTVLGISNAVDVDAGGLFMCAALDDGTVRCWGDNGRGQLGNSDAPTDSPTPVVVLGVSGVISVHAGGDHACALSSPPGAVRCWGANTSGELGDGTTTDRPSPIPVPILARDVTSVTVGGTHSCAMFGRRPYCWGDGARGQLGTGGTSMHLEPVPASAVGEIVDIAAGGSHTCAVTTEGSVSCWGLNDTSQVGAASPEDQVAPVAVPPPG